MDPVEKTWLSDVARETTEPVITAADQGAATKRRLHAASGVRALR